VIGRTSQAKSSYSGTEKRKNTHTHTHAHTSYKHRVRNWVKSQKLSKNNLKLDRLQCIWRHTTI